MDHKVTIVVLSKYKEIFDPFFESLEKFDQGASLIVVADGSSIGNEGGSRFFLLSGEYNHKVKVINGPDQFSMAGNGNLGLKAVPTDHDILYVGDDIRFLEPRTIEKLQEIAYKDETIGILSPRLIGRGSPSQVNPQGEINEVKPLEMWFPCVYIKREVIEKIGYLDELFNDFGSDDLDFCIRTKLAGYKLAVTSKVAVKHEASPEGGPTTFCKKLGVQKWQQQQQEAFMKLRQKYAVSPVIFDRFLITGDVSLLQKKPKAEVTIPSDITDGMLCTQEEAKEFLKTRHICIATPMYGGWASINYINSVLSLSELCRKYDVTLTYLFMYNESLITRARNKLADLFMKKEDATDFVFIDADIGFDPRDIITLTLRGEDIVGAPCAKKNLRLDRVVQAVKANGRDYSIDELENMLGDIVMNFAPGAVPPTMNLGKTLEVLEVGTGLMRIRRETLNKFIEFYPDRWYLQMTGETDNTRQPMYMFFQAGIDEETRRTNPHACPDYISEDYWFCREARKAGMKIWLAPWIKTSHMGSYFFKADMVAMSENGAAFR